MNKRELLTLFFLAIITASVFYIYYLNQPYLTYAGCALCDGNQYLKIYDYFSGISSHYSVPFPYYSRVFVPLLASWFSGSNPIAGFQMVNLLFSVLGSISLYLLWRKLELPIHCILIGFFWLLFHWTGMIRLNAFDPVTVDLPTYLFQALIILICINRQFLWLCLLGPLAVFQRESIIVLLTVLAVLIYINNRYRITKESMPLVPVIVAVVLTILVKCIFTYYYPSADTGKSSIRLVLFYIKEVMVDPFKLVRWLVALCMAYGAFLFLAVKHVQRKYFDDNQFILLSVISVTYVLLAIVAGGDSTRIAYLGFPFVMTWILCVCKDLPVKYTLVALAFSLLPMRLTGIIPDPGKDFLGFASWYPEFAESKLVWMWGLYFIFSFLGISLFEKFYKR